MRRAPIPRKGKSETTKIKDDIQAYARAIVIERDGGCILRRYRFCSDAVLQADHLITRANSATFADTRLIVCVCRSCHAWKSLGSNRNKAQYDDLVKRIISPERVALWERCERDSWRPHRTGLYDWKIQLAALKQEYASYQQSPTLRAAA